MEIGDRIKQYRKEHNLTQEEFARKIHVSKQAVSKWETKRGYPDIAIYPTLAEMLKVSVDELLGSRAATRAKPRRWFISPPSRSRSYL
ncbi:MAG TPA: helix-turn-helix transcriptional regulator [Acholeplasmataceae bacterium]|nr:helix-turn-helix transcriptional regulator [Acholeplasmataceae bacterium]